LYLYDKLNFIIFVTMIDLVYKTLLTIINKENQGYVSPTEFNILANNVQMEIFRSYFEDNNRDENKENRGLTNKGYSNLSFNQRQMIQQFAEVDTISISSGRFNLPEDLYFIEDNGVTTGSGETYPNRVVDESERNELGYLNLSLAAPTALYPVYERYNDYLIISPSSIEEIILRYLREPKTPNWTYFTVSSGDPLYNPADVDFQDFELHPSEFSNIVLKMLSYFGLNLRETEVVQIAETLKDKMNLKDNN
jgi:hypothetical protein